MSANNLKLELNYYLPVYNYIDGLLEIILVLFENVEILLEAEGRYFGIMKRYMRRIKITYIKIRKSTNLNETDVVNIGKMLYLFKPVILKEYNILKSRKVTKADSIITIIKKLIEIIMVEKDHPQYSKVEILYDIISKIFNNIRNRGKYHKMTKFTDIVKKYIYSGQLGKYELTHFSILNEENKEKITTIIGDREKIKEEYNIGEISL